MEVFGKYPRDYSSDPKKHKEYLNFAGEKCAQIQATIQFMANNINNNFLYLRDKDNATGRQVSHSSSTPADLRSLTWGGVNSIITQYLNNALLSSNVEEICANITNLEGEDLHVMNVVAESMMTGSAAKRTAFATVIINTVLSLAFQSSDVEYLSKAKTMINGLRLSLYKGITNSRKMFGLDLIGNLKTLDATLSIARAKADKDQLTADKDQLTADKDQLTADKDQLTADKDQLTADKDQIEEFARMAFEETVGVDLEAEYPPSVIYAYAVWKDQLEINARGKAKRSASDMNVTSTPQNKGPLT